MTVYSAILHDSYPDENGNETPYEDKIIAAQKKDGDFKCSSLPDFDTFDMLNEEFFKKCTDIKVIFEQATLPVWAGNKGSSDRRLNENGITGDDSLSM